MLSRPCRKEGPLLEMTGESCGFFRATVGLVAFLSNYEGELREPFMCSQESPVSIRVARESTALLLIQGRGIAPQNMLKGESRGLS